MKVMAAQNRGLVPRDFASLYTKIVRTMLRTKRKASDPRIQGRKCIRNSMISLGPEDMVAHSIMIIGIRRGGRDDLLVNNSAAAGELLFRGSRIGGLRKILDRDPMRHERRESLCLPRLSFS
jgi:hypothetical protein